jgi:hypothetical protein
MKRIGVEEVLVAAERLLASSSRQPRQESGTTSG